MIQLIVVMIVAGIAGGTVNYALLSDGDRTGWGAWCRASGMGLAASFLMPLFLNTISSSLVPNILDAKGGAGDILFFAGFCLLAAISSRAFITTLSDKILREARDAKQQAQRAREEIANIEQAVDTFVEPDSDGEVREIEFRIGDLTEGDSDILRAMHHPNYRLRSAAGVAAQASISPTEAEANLGALAEKGFVSVMRGKRGDRWALTLAGQRATDASRPEENRDIGD